MIKDKNKDKVQTKSVRVAIQLTDEEIKAFDKMYSLFDVHITI
jgi:hypothetical protein